MEASEGLGKTLPGRGKGKRKYPEAGPSLVRGRQPEVGGGERVVGDVGGGGGGQGS